MIIIYFCVWTILCICLIFFHSRFTKNLSADKINLSTFKGEGELSNLELDEIVLTELLELPSWLRLTNAWCNRVSFRIQWTKLKSVPIFLVSFETVWLFLHPFQHSPFFLYCIFTFIFRISWNTFVKHVMKHCSCTLSYLITVCYLKQQN